MKKNMNIRPETAASEFSCGYASQYDIIYNNKDYNAECDLIEKLIKRYKKGKIKSVLDLGCGTGNHAIPLAQRGYEVTGIDRSDWMLAEAKRKANVNPSLCVNFLKGDIRKYSLSKKYDLVLMMFAVLGYQLTNRDVASALACARGHLRKGGLLIFDVWYGPAVLTVRPCDRIKIVTCGTGKIVRAASGELNIRNHICRVRYRLWHFDKGRILNEIEETHQVRYFFPMEIEQFLKSAKLDLIKLAAFPSTDDEADESTWNAVIVASFKKESAYKRVRSKK